MGLYATFSDNVKRSPRFALILGLLLYLFSLMTLIPLLMQVLSWAFDLPMQELQTIMQGNIEGNASIFRWMQAGNQVLTWGLVGWLMARMVQRPALELQLRAPEQTWQGGLTPLIILCSLPLVQWLQIDAEGLELPSQLEGIEAWMEEQESVFGDALNAILMVNAVPTLLANLLVFAVVPAFSEEIFFRGFLQRQLMRAFRSPWVAILVQALIFSFIHFQFYGFFARAFLGAILGYAAWRSRSLWPCILGHFCFNGSSVLMAYVAAAKAEATATPPSAELSFSPWFILASLVLVAALLLLFQRLSSMPPAPERSSSTTSTSSLDPHE